MIGVAPGGAFNDGLRAACLSAMTISPQAGRQFAARRSREASARALIENITDIAADSTDEPVLLTGPHPRFVA